MQTLSDILGQQYGLAPKPFRPDRQKVRRHSRLAGREGVFWRPVKRQEARQIVLAARRYEVRTKAAGKREGALGTVAIEILDYLANLVDYRTGRLEPAIATMMEKTGRCRAAIVRGLKNLRAHGFLDWIRRYVPTDNDGAGVQVQQTSNAYRLFMPKRALALLGRYGQKPPAPDDFDYAQQAHAALVEDMLKGLSDLERIDAEMGADNPLGASLKRLRIAMKKRESAKQTESPSKLNIIGKNDGLSPDFS